MGFSVVEATNARCMRRKRGELRRLARTVLFRVVPEDFLWDRTAVDCGLVVALVLSGACANAGADEPMSALKHSAKRKNFENPATFL